VKCPRCQLDILIQPRSELAFARMQAQNELLLKMNKSLHKKIQHMREKYNRAKRKDEENEKSP
jgi:hypothetical protein